MRIMMRINMMSGRVLISLRVVVLAIRSMMSPIVIMTMMYNMLIRSVMMRSSTKVSKSMTRTTVDAVSSNYLSLLILSNPSLTAKYIQRVD